jgi:hypothetical protein
MLLHEPSELPREKVESLMHRAVLYVSTAEAPRDVVTRGQAGDVFAG